MILAGIGKATLCVENGAKMLPCVYQEKTHLLYYVVYYISRNDSLAQMNGNGYRMHDACTLLPCVLERTIYRSFEVHEIEHIKETIVKYAFACIFGYI